MISIWEREAFYNDADFVIAGAGLCGLWCAWELRQAYPNAKITLLEKEHISCGASTRNAGFACFGSPTEMLNNIGSMGEDQMWQVVEMRYRGIQKIRQVFGDAEIDYDHCGGYECFIEVIQPEHKMREVVKLLNKGMKGITGSAESFSWSNKKLERFGFRGMDSMVENRLEGSLHSGKLVKALLRAVVASGVQVLFSTGLKGWTSTGDWVHLDIEHCELRCRQLLICTNALTGDLATNTNIIPARGQVLVTAPVPGLALKGTFHFDDGYYYFRNLGNRILLGGARNKSFEEEYTLTEGISSVIQDELERFLNSHLPRREPYSITDRWSGTMAFTDDKKPFVRSLTQNVHALVACNGMGVALTPIIAEQAVQLFKVN
ncbi:FAD-binding oxidoreductase [Segetibacter sp. 3557_3]|uniref:NAD(P)/FAD-dependent oxidoreductase n=1 Tax=Segetibacter sp. 3557_3 TaxID=2547429 RepID=UPI001058E512|nr:FAD-dependent oxidoreductase [Segetibacter sp. 3557_3]TDH29305.1 FAD-binding oxidoreductase [Segetibacter sp. 3557_3]